MMVIPTQNNLLQGQLELQQVAASLVNSLIDLGVSYLDVNRIFYFIRPEVRARHFGVGGWSPVVEMLLNL